MIPFTIQSISKAFVFALALETVGAKAVEETIGVEPSGDAFNSIRLNSENRPFNAMVNSGAITCSGLIYKAEGRDAFECIRESLSRFAGRQLSVDNAVFLSECATGDRNRARRPRSDARNASYAWSRSKERRTRWVIGVNLALFAMTHWLLSVRHRSF